MTIKRSAIVCSLILSGLATGSCLPKDTRPVPGRLDVTVTADESLLGGAPSPTITADGWTVSFERFLLALGDTVLDGDTCASYANGEYGRIFNMRVSGPQKVSTNYALGHCDFGFRVAGPDPDSVLGEGVTEADRDRMGVPEGDLHTKNEGMALFAQGRATKDSVTKTFKWAFRQRIRFENCGAAADGGLKGFELKGRDARTTDLVAHGEALFMDSTDPEDAVLRFDSIAEADDKHGNSDGEVTQAELAEVTLPAAGLENRYAKPDVPDAGASTLEAYLYVGLFPKVVRFGTDGECTRHTRGEH